jgi:hypothetical protein
MNFPAYYLIPGIIGVVAWGAIIIVWIVTRNRRRPSEEQDSALTKVLSRLDSLDDRLAKVEKTLNDIP